MAKHREKAIVAIGPLPPPYNGQSISFRMLVDRLERTEKVIPINIAITADPDQPRLAGILQRAGSFFKVAFELLPVFRKYDCRVYLTISQSSRGFTRDYMIIALAYRFNHPVIAHLKGGNYGGFYRSQRRLMRKLIRNMLGRVETLVVLGKRLKSMYDFDPSLAEKVVVVENGLPFDKEPGVANKMPTDEVGVLFLSNMIESKGYMELLTAAAICKEHRPKIHIHFAGMFQDSSDDILVDSAAGARAAFDEKIKELQIEDRVTYHGLVIGEEKTELLNRCHIFALPTRYINEGQPVSIIESIAFGLPIIATDFRAITDMVISNQTGVLVRPYNPEDIAKAILYIADPARYEQMSQACLDLFNAKFTREAHLKRLLPHLLHAQDD